MKELETEIVKAFTKMSESGTIQKIVEDRITKTVTEILDKALQSYSDFGKELEKTVKEGLKVDFDRLGLIGYNDIVLRIIKAKLDNSIEIVGKARIEKELEDLLKAPPAEVKLSALVDMLKEEQRDGNNGCTCIVEYSTGLVDGYGHVYMDQHERTEKHRCDIMLSFTDKGEIYNISIDGRDPNKKLFIGPFFGFERSLFQMYVAKTKLIVDEDDANTEYDQD